MRIISGMYGGRSLYAPKGNTTHPMSEKIRAALFNMLGDISSRSFLDAYAGSGAVGLEAISRGAKSATLIEKNRTSAKVIARNVDILGVSSQVELVVDDNQHWSNHHQQHLYDIVFLDPPFQKFDKKPVENLVKHVKTSGIMILSTQGSVEAPVINGVVVVETRLYGGAALHFYRPEVSADKVD